MRSSLLAAALFALVPFSQAQTSTWTIDPAHSGADFQVKHLAVSTVRGSITGVKGTVILDEKNFENSSVTATLDATTVNTSNDRRNAHIKGPDFFDVEKFPTLTFKSTKITTSNGKHQITGDLTLAGVTKSVTLDVDGPAPPQKGQRGGLVSGFSATGMIKRTDFNFGQKTPASAAISDEVKFTIDVEIDKP